MELKRIDYKLTVCKVAEVSNINMDSDFYFIGKTDEEKEMIAERLEKQIRAGDIKVEMK